MRVWGAVLITDTFTRTVAGGWGATTGNTVALWQGDLYGLASVDGSRGSLTLDYNFYTTMRYLNWSVTPEPAMDITLTVELSRALAGADSIGWGEFLVLWCGDGPPWGTGKFLVAFTGELGMIIRDATGAWESTWAAIPVDMTDPFRVRITRAAVDDSDIDVYVWPTSGVQPVTPTLSCPGGDFSHHGFTVQLSSDNAEIASDLTAYADDLNIVGSEDW